MSKGFGFPHLIKRLLRDEEGSYLLYMTVAIPVFIGFAGFATATSCRLRALMLRQLQRLPHYRPGGL